MERIGKLLGVLLLVLSGATSAQAFDVGGTQCPNQKASLVPARVEFSGGYRRCGLGLTVFGVGGAIIGDRCYKFETLYPAHAACQGETAEGTRCVPDSVAPVLLRECECGGLILPGLNTGIPTRCTCDEWRNAGTVETSKTVAC